MARRKLFLVITDHKAYPGLVRRVPGSMLARSVEKMAPSFLRVIFDQPRGVTATQGPPPDYHPISTRFVSHPLPRPPHQFGALMWLDIFDGLGSQKSRMRRRGRNTCGAAKIIRPPKHIRRSSSRLCTVTLMQQSDRCSCPNGCLGMQAIRHKRRRHTIPPTNALRAAGISDCMVFTSRGALARQFHTCLFPIACFCNRRTVI